MQLADLSLRAQAAFSQAWPAFALVAGLLLVGAAAAREGVFAEAGALAARARGGAVALLAALMVVEAAVTTVLNLDTAVVFMTPVLLQAARGRGVSEAPFLYGSVFIANSASLLLPGSNLTNLIVLARDPVPGTDFAAGLWPAWIAAVAVTIVFVVCTHRREFAREAVPHTARPAFRPRAGAVGIVVSGALVLLFSRPALPVLGVGLVVVALARSDRRELLRAANPLLLLCLLAAAVGLGTLARSVAGVGRLASHAGRWQAAWLGAGAAVLVNNLPAAMMLAAHAPAHPRALLLGLDLGPNLAVSGSLSAVLWLQVARANGARPSVLRYSLLGSVLVPLSLALGLLASITV
jgi:arsenical pump membrane protein